MYIELGNKRAINSKFLSPLQCRNKHRQGLFFIQFMMNEKPALQIIILINILVNIL